MLKEIKLTYLLPRNHISLFFSLFTVPFLPRLTLLTWNNSYLELEVHDCYRIRNSDIKSSQIHLLLRGIARFSSKIKNFPDD